MEIKKVSRENDIKVLFEIIDHRKDYKEISENGLVILLNGSWGSGKTMFLKDLEEYINNSDNYDLFTTYNSYNYDFYENAYLPFFASIEDKVKLGKDFGKLIKSTSKDFLNGIVSVSYAVTKEFFRKKFDIDLDDIKDNMIEIQNEEYLKNFEDFKHCKEKVKTKLIEYCEEKPQIIIIDELDRCKPSFAMETLEIIKHFFDIENCIFVIAIDKLQLQESAKTIYGQKMDSEKYFSKFFDYQYNLLPLNFNEIIDTSGIEDLEEIINRSTTIFNHLKVSSRDSKKIFSEFINKYKKYSTGDNVWTSDQSVVIIFLLTLKYVDLLFYTELINGNFGRFKNKITGDLNPTANNYIRLLGISIGNQKNFDYLCNKITYSLDKIYMDKSKINSTVFPIDDEYEQSKSITKELMSYIPQIEPNITYKQTIEKIIN